MSSIILAPVLGFAVVYHVVAVCLHGCQLCPYPISMATMLQNNRLCLSPNTRPPIGCISNFEYL